MTPKVKKPGKNAEGGVDTGGLGKESNGKGRGAGLKG